MWQSSVKVRARVFGPLDSNYFSSGIACGANISDDSDHSDGGFKDDVFQGSEITDVGFLDGIDTEGLLEYHEKNIADYNTNSVCVPVCPPASPLKSSGIIDLIYGGRERAHTRNLTFIRLA